MATVVTKAPSEPWEMVRATLRAMLDQELDRPFDVWLADEDPAPSTLAWCGEHGVGVCTRRDAGPDYHRDTWPRRKRCKEGNLAYFYDVVGYERYDVVAQLDADHVPERDYLLRITAPFARPDVGYVAAPSICDLNAAESWSARGRLHDEALLHGVMHAGANGGYAASCIGSHYAVRTAAVREIGGLGPDLAEDFSTTLLLSAAGWDGVFAIDAIAHGRGPDTVADCLTQELQWSRSMMTLLLTIGPKAWRALAPRRRIRLGFCLVWYPMISCLVVLAHLMPLWALAQGGPLVAVDLQGYLLHLLLVEGTVLMAVLVVRRSGAMRPVDAPVVSWELVLYRMIRWPWIALGVLTAVYVVVTRRSLEWKVTPKGADALSRPLDLRVLLPPMLVVGVFVVPVMLADDPTAAGGYFFSSGERGVPVGSRGLAGRPSALRRAARPARGAAEPGSGGLRGAGRGARRGPLRRAGGAGGAAGRWGPVTGLDGLVGSASPGPSDRSPGPASAGSAPGGGDHVAVAGEGGLGRVVVPQQAVAVLELAAGGVRVPHGEPADVRDAVGRAHPADRVDDAGEDGGLGGLGPGGRRRVARLGDRDRRAVPEARGR